MPSTNFDPPPAPARLGGMHHRWRWASLLVAATLVASPLWAQLCPRPPGVLDRAHSPLDDIVVDGGFAYVADAFGLTIYDVSTPTAPHVVGSELLASEPRTLAVAAGVAYLAAGRRGIDVVDVTDPEDPRWLRTVDVGGWAADVAADGDLLVVAAGSDGLVTFDVRDPRRPRLLGRCAPHSSMNHVALSGRLAYVSEYSFGLVIVDCADARYPVEVGAVPLEASTRYVAFSGHTVFTVNRQHGVWSIDVSDPTAPVLVWPPGEDSVRAREGDFGSIAANGDLVFVMQSRELVVLDESDPRAPREIGSLQLAGFPLSVTAGDGRAYVAAGGAGVMVVEIGDGASPHLLGRASPGEGWAYDAVEAGSRLLVADGRGLTSIAEPTLASPTVSDRVDLPLGATTVTMVHDLAVVAGSGGLTTVHVSGSGPALVLGSLPLDIWPGDSIAVGSTVYLRFNYGVVGVDVSDPWSPQEVDGVVGGYYVTDVAAVGESTLAVSDYGWLVLFDASDPRDLLFLGNVPVGCKYSNLAAAGDLVVAGCSTGELRLLDVSDPAAPRAISSVDLGDPVTALSISGSTVYAALDGARLVSVDVSNPLSPRVTGRVRLHRTASAIAASAKGDFVAAAGGVVLETVSTGCPEGEVKDAQRSGAAAAPPLWERSTGVDPSVVPKR